jgi:hypothetical protein
MSEFLRTLSLPPSQSKLESVCVFDFCGFIHPGHFPWSAWADYWVESKVCTFGGDWADVPDWYVDSEPSEAAAEAHANAWIAEQRP